jgi:4-aminobutyrate aminotransferase-like enzyme
MFLAGDGARLIDASGRRYLDTRNNVAHVGHGHRGVASAVSAQVAKVNSNSRYLHPLRTALAAKLRRTMPGALGEGLVFFVNSGSEANDLALRMARAATGGQHCLVLEHAYHGHTAGVIELSPYKFKHARYVAAGWPVPQHTTVVPAPDLFRPDPAMVAACSQHNNDADPAAALTAGYVAAVKAAAEARRGHLAAFFVESGMSVAGVIIPPPGYMQQCFEAVRAAGGICVADEVQTGLGRMGGGAWWAFEEHGVVPDIVTLGKPFGNGMPLAAVVTTRAVADAFAAGPEYFNTFGGNPVCCAAGLAVLHALETEGLREAATRVGHHLRTALLHLAGQPEGRPIGDVRGRGLFLGVDFVQDRRSREPAPRLASWLCTRLKTHHYILTSLDGPCDNVMVIKPPMCFSEKDADAFVAALRAELHAYSTGTVDLDSVQATPT